MPWLLYPFKDESCPCGWRLGSKKMQNSSMLFSWLWRATRAVTFEETFKRAKNRREAAEWRFLRLTLPEPEQSKFFQTKSNLAPADLLEYCYLRMSEEDFNRCVLKDLSERQGPIVTGDPVIDELERSIWEMSSGSRAS